MEFTIQIINGSKYSQTWKNATTTDVLAPSASKKFTKGTKPEDKFTLPPITITEDVPAGAITHSITVRYDIDKQPQWDLETPVTGVTLGTEVAEVSLVTITADFPTS